MTKTERHEIAVVTKLFIEDKCDEIRNAYEALYGNLKGLRSYIRKECIEFWTNSEPYLDVHFLDREWIDIGSNIIDLDGCWCFIRDGLKFDLEKK